MLPLPTGSLIDSSFLIKTHGKLMFSCAIWVIGLHFLLAASPHLDGSTT